MGKSVFSKKTTPMRAFVSIMENSDLDRPSLDISKWCRTKYGDLIISVFEDKSHLPSLYRDRKFLLVETPEETVGKQVKALALYSAEKDNIDLNVLQSENQMRWFQKTKGAGSLIIYTLTKIAEALGKKEVIVDADRAACNFYKKIGMKMKQLPGYKNKSRVFVLTQDMFKDFQRKMEEKFNIMTAQ